MAGGGGGGQRLAASAHAHLRSQAPGRVLRPIPVVALLPGSAIRVAAHDGHRRETGPGPNVGFRFLVAGFDGAAGLRNRIGFFADGPDGAPPEPEPATRSQKAIAGESLAHAVAKALSEWIDKGPVKNAYVDQYVYPFLYLNLETLHKQNTPIRGARKLAGETALRVPGVAGYYTADGDCSHTGEWRRRFENSFHELRSGDVMLSYEAEAVEDFGAGRGVSYGSLYDYDTSVPLFLYGPQFGKRVIEHAVELVDLAPTVARAAGIGTPSSNSTACSITLL